MNQQRPHLPGTAASFWQTGCARYTHAIRCVTRSYNSEKGSRAHVVNPDAASSGKRTTAGRTFSGDCAITNPYPANKPRV